jgi:hypothetical protein
MRKMRKMMNCSTNKNEAVDKYTLILSTSPFKIDCVKFQGETSVGICERYNIDPYEVSFIFEATPKEVTHRLTNTLNQDH